MVEEAAGTRMYETKRENALKLMEKKDARLREINTILNEHITPTLVRLKEERKIYIEYTKIVRELDHLTKLFIAWQFIEAQKISKASAEEEQRLVDTLKNAESHIKQLTDEAKEADEKIKELEKKKDEEAGGKLHELEENLKKYQITETKTLSKFENLQEAHSDEKKKATNLKKSLADDKALVSAKENDLQNAEKELIDLKNLCEKDAEEALKAHKHFQAISAGLSADDKGQDASLVEQLMKVTNEGTSARTEAESLKLSIQQMKLELQRKKDECKKMDSNKIRDQAAFKAKECEVNKLKAEIEALGYDAQYCKNLEAERSRLAKEIQNLKDRLDSINSRFPQLAFDYTDPTKNFDRKKVHGLVCILIELIDPKTATALDLTAGARLYNVVVDNEITGKLILDRGRLKRRYTIIPLNKIIGRPIENRIVQEAERLVGKNNVSTALSLVIYKPELKPAMEYVFGGTFICSGMQSAKKVTFANNIKRRCVTIDGEVFDPSGTLSGGSMGHKGKLLAELAQLSVFRKQVVEKQQQLTKMDKEILNMYKLQERYGVLKQQFDLKSSEYEFFKSKQNMGDQQLKVKDMENVEIAFEKLKARLEECYQIEKNSEKMISKLQSKMSNTKSNREDELKACEQAVSDTKKKSDASEKKYKEFEASIDSIKMEIADLIKNIPVVETQLENAFKIVEELAQKVKDVQTELKEIKDNISSAIQEVKEQKQVMKNHSIEIAKLHKQKDSMLKKAESSRLQNQQLEHDIKRFKEQSQEANEKVKQLQDSYKWIEEDKKFFGVKNTEYDFDKQNPQEAGQRISKLEEEKASMQNNVNMRAQNMLLTVEDQFKDLVKKREVVLNDKSRIEDVITELDDQKKKALKHACIQVNKDFGSIFSTLLPGTSAKLVPLDNKTVLEGLEFKVAFGDVWKESLTELSGGQRSLVALSLILSLLLFNPAPIYILDEVDAALDLSHTQNIGKMLRIHFKKSQFIVVSLKDGMFNNANVLFKTRFVDGMSTVARVAHKRSNDD